MHAPRIQPLQLTHPVNALWHWPSRKHKSCWLKAPDTMPGTMPDAMLDPLLGARACRWSRIEAALDSLAQAANWAEAEKTGRVMPAEVRGVTPVCGALCVLCVCHTCLWGAPCVSATPSECHLHACAHMCARVDCARVHVL